MASYGIDRTGAAGGSGAASLIGALAELTDPNADRLVLWDDSAGGFDWASFGTGLSVSNTVLQLGATLVDVAGLAVTDGGVIVGDGSNFVLETGATLRTSLGLGTGDSPTFAGLTLTAALPVAQGGTGSSTATAAATALGLGTGDSPTFTGLTLTGTLGVAGAATFSNTVAVSSNTLTVIAPAKGLSLQLRGRSSDNVSLLRAYSYDGVTAYGYVQFTASETHIQAPTANFITLTDDSSEVARTTTGWLYITGSGLDVRSAGTLRVHDSTNADYGDQSHDGTDYNWAFTNTTDLNITGLTNINLGGIPLGLTISSDVATTSGTTAELTGIPAGIKQFTMCFDGISNDASGSNAYVIVQLGSASAGYATTSYESAACHLAAAGTTVVTSASNGFLINGAFGSNSIDSGALTFTLANSASNLWVVSGTTIQFVAGSMRTGSTGGRVELSEVLDRVRVNTIGGTANFDAGRFTIVYTR